MYAFGTVTTVTMAIAMYMGYKEIYLIGADCTNLNKHFINDVTDKDKDDKKECSCEEGECKFQKQETLKMPEQKK